MLKVLMRLKREPDLARREDVSFLRAAENLSVDGTVHYSFVSTADSVGFIWRDRYIYNDTVGDESVLIDEFQKYSIVSSVAVVDEDSTGYLLGITGNPCTLKCMRTANHIAGQYQKAAGIWPLGYNQGVWDSSAMVCFDYLVFASGRSSSSRITSLIDSTVTFIAGNYATYVSNILDSTHYLDRFVQFPTRSVSPYHSLQRYRVSKAECNFSSGRLYVALTLCENDVARTPITSADAIYNLGVRSGYTTDANAQADSVFVAGICHQLHWSLDSSDALCTNGQYASGQMYVSGTPHRTSSLGWNADGYQVKKGTDADSTVGTGFTFDGLTLYPVVRSHMTLCTQEGSSPSFYHNDLDNDGDTQHGIDLYNAGLHRVFVNNARKILYNGDPLVYTGSGFTAGPISDWSQNIEHHLQLTVGVVGGRWNKRGIVGIAPGCSIDPELSTGYLTVAADYGLADVASYSFEGAYLSLFGNRYYYDVVGDMGDTPLGSFGEASVVDYCAQNGLWVTVPPFGNYTSEYYTYDTEVITCGAFTVWDGTSNAYSHGEALDFVSPVPVLSPSSFYSPSAASEDNKFTYREFSGQSCTTPVAAAYLMLLKERRPEIDYTQAKQLLARSCRKFPDMTDAQSFWHYKYGFGRPDIDVAVSLDTTAAGCPAPKGLIVDGEGTGYAKLRWTNPHYKDFVETKILRKRYDTTNAYRTFAIVYSSLDTLDNVNEAQIPYTEYLKWTDVVMTDPPALADMYSNNSDSTFMGKCTVYLDIWLGGSYISQYDHVNKISGWNASKYSIIPYPGDSTHYPIYPNGQPEIRVKWSDTRYSYGYVIDSTGFWAGCVLDKLTDFAKRMYDEGTPLYGIFLDDWANIHDWSYILTSTAAGEPVSHQNHYDRNGNQNDSSAAFVLYPDMWPIYLASPYHTTSGYEWGQMTKTEQNTIISSWISSVMTRTSGSPGVMYYLEQKLNDVVSAYCAPGGRLVLNGSYRRMSGLTPTYSKSSRLFEGVSANNSNTSMRWDVLEDGYLGSTPRFAYYAQPDDFVLVFSVGSSGNYGDWVNTSYVSGFNDTQYGASFALRRNFSLGISNGTFRNMWNPNDSTSRWPLYVSNRPYMTNHSDGTIVYTGVQDQCVDRPGVAGSYVYTAFARDKWGKWSDGGIGFAQALKRKSKTTFTVSQVVDGPWTGVRSVYGSISPGGASFTIGGETAYNDSTVFCPVMGPGSMPHGQGWYAVGSQAKEVYPVMAAYYYGAASGQRGKISYFLVDSDYVDSTTFYAGQTLDIQYLSLHVGNHNTGVPFNVRNVQEPTFPREAVTLTADTSPWFDQFNPVLEVQASYTAPNVLDFSIINVRNPMGIKDVYIYRYNGANPTEDQWPAFPTYNLLADSTCLTTFREVDNHFPVFTSYKIVPVSVSGQISNRPIYLLNFPTSLIDISAPILEDQGLFLGFSPQIGISNTTGIDVSVTVYKNGQAYASGILPSEGLVFYDMFWLEGDTYKVKVSYYGYDSGFSNTVTPAYPGIPTAAINIDLPGPHPYKIPLGDYTYAEFSDSYSSSMYRAASNRLGRFSLGQNVWTPTLVAYQYRTSVVPREYGGREIGEGLAPQFEFWNAQDLGDLLLRFEVNPIEFEFDFGIRKNRIPTLDGPDKVQLMYQDQVLRSMIWRNIPIQRYGKFISEMRIYIGRDVWLDSKDFTMPIRGEWPFKYMSGYRYKINIVDIIVKPVDGPGHQRADVVLKYKLVTSGDAGVV